MHGKQLMEVCIPLARSLSPLYAYGAMRATGCMTECLQEHVRALTEAHFVSSSVLGIPKAELDADRELLLGKCKQCSATRLLASLAEHEAACRPDQELARQPPAAPPLPAAAEGSSSMLQVHLVCKGGLQLRLLCV